MAPRILPHDARELSLLLRALGALGGAVVVLDEALRVVAATPDAEGLAGTDLAPGVSAPKLLCGEALDRPLAEGLAAGRPVTATVPRPSPGGGERLVRVRAVPLPAEGEEPPGWALLLDEDAPGTGADAPDAPVTFHGILTRDPAMKRIFQIVSRVATSEASVLVRGETGTGKELVAHAIHQISARRRGPFRALNCGALPPSLLESELFGHVRGAFTGAVRDNPGHFAMADKGTLFLDEVAEMPLDLQARLLRVLETRTVIPVGARDPVTVDVRIVAATHRSLRADVEAGRFRADLMYRLRVVPVFLPPLRARQGDVALLARQFLDELAARGGRRIDRVSPGARAALERHDWPGNVRELRNALEYASVVGDGPVLVESDLPPELLDPTTSPDAEAPRANAPPPLADGVAASPEAARIRRALERAGGNRERAARALGMSRVTLWRKMKALGLALA